MRRRHGSLSLLKHLLGGAACCALAVGTARGQVQTAAGTGYGSGPACVVPCPAPCERVPTAPPTTPSTTPRREEAVPPVTSPNTPPISNEGQQSPQAPELASERAAAVGSENVRSVAGGYLDNPIPVSQLRLRFDAMYDDNRPDRADFFYPKCGCFRATGDTSARGPAKMPETKVDYQELRSYLEYAFDPRVSIFGELPQRWINPDVNDNAEGLGDVNFGAKFAFLYETDQVATLQVRAFAPTGDPGLGLGTGTWWVEPSLLYYQKLADRFFLQAEVSDYIPIAAHDGYAGNVLRYGFGLNYLLVSQQCFRVAPVVEFVGWTVLTGKETDFDTPEATRSASGDTIVNGKFGVRFGFGQLVEPGMLSRSDLYVGYGRALTGEFWYKDMFRVEYRLNF